MLRLMVGAKSMRFVFLLLLAWALSPNPNAGAQEVTTVSAIVVENLDGSYNLFFYVTAVTGPQGPIPETNAFQGPILSITNRGTNVPFNIVVQTSLLQICLASPATPLQSVGETFSLFDGNVVTNIYVPLGPVFLTQPQSQSLFVAATPVSPRRRPIAPAINGSWTGPISSIMGIFPA